jgi:hypothetical protein
MIPMTALLLARALEAAAMPLKPRSKPQGIPIGSTHKLNPKTGILEPVAKRKPLPQMIAAKKKRRWRAAK